MRVKQAFLILSAGWLLFLISMFLPAVTVYDGTTATVTGKEATFFSIVLLSSMFQGFEPAILSFIGLANIAFIFSPLFAMLIKRGKYPWYATVMLSATLVVASLPLFSGIWDGEVRVGFYLWLSAFALVTFGLRNLRPRKNLTGARKKILIKIFASFLTLFATFYLIVSIGSDRLYNPLEIFRLPVSTARMLLYIDTNECKKSRRYFWPALLDSVSSDVQTMDGKDFRYALPPFTAYAENKTSEGGYVWKKYFTLSRIYGLDWDDIKKNKKLGWSPGEGIKDYSFKHVNGKNWMTMDISFYEGRCISEISVRIGENPDEKNEITQ